MSDEGFRRLAAAVLIRAVKDINGMPDQAVSNSERISIRQCAREFLHPEHELFAVYCGLLDLDPVAAAAGMKRRGRLVAEEARRTERREARI